MQFTVHAASSGKRVRVQDRIAGTEAYNDFLAPDATAPVQVASNDGQTGDVDISAQMRADAPWVVLEQDYPVKAGDVYDVGDV
jgi:hypothetical protein